MLEAFSSPQELLAKRGWLDRLGATGSLLCAVHCAALPIVLVLAPALGASLANHAFEVGFVAFASVLALTSLLMGYRHHHRASALALLLPGCGLLWIGVALDTLHVGGYLHAIAMAGGGTVLACAHVVNLRHARHAGCQTHHVVVSTTGAVA
ncbi:MAG: MerC domain-containing protein [Proteobacteria bacterium]|nr:MerC domain-containing protein [Pseudomonadota bacterium]